MFFKPKIFFIRVLGKIWTVGKVCKCLRIQGRRLKDKGRMFENDFDALFGESRTKNKGERKES